MFSLFYEKIRPGGRNNVLHLYYQIELRYATISAEEPV